MMALIYNSQWWLLSAHDRHPSRYPDDIGSDEEYGEEYTKDHFANILFLS